jgi:hypothetical protein
MPRCIICKGKWFGQTYDSPAESCDCGQCLSERDRAEMSEADWDEARKYWETLQQLEKESIAQAESDKETEGEN